MKVLDERISFQKGSDCFVPPMACEAVVFQGMIEQSFLDAVQGRFQGIARHVLILKMTWTRVIISRWGNRCMMCYSGVLLSTDT